MFITAAIHRTIRCTTAAEGGRLLAPHVPEPSKTNFRRLLARLRAFLSYRGGRCPHWLKILNPSYERR
jgi:hypothetical protein